MKTLLIANTPSHYRSEIYRKLSEIGVDFYFSDLSTSIKSMDLKDIKSKCRFGKFLGSDSRIHFVFGAISETFKYDRIIAVGNLRSIHVWVILIYCFFSKKKVYLWTHGWYGREGFFKKIFKKCYFNLSDRILTYNETAKKLMLSEGFSSSKIIPIYNSLSSDRQIRIRQDIISHQDNDTNKGVYSDRPYFFFVGRINKNKKLGLVLEAMKKIKSSDFDFLVIGPEVDNGVFRNQVNNLGLEDRVKFAGPLYDESALAKLIGRGIACIAPGNIGLTAIHSLTYGTPVITHDRYEEQMPESEAVIEGETGFRFEFGSVNSLAHCMQNFLNYNLEDYQSISENCINLVDEKWNSESQLNIFKNLLDIK